MRVRMACCPVFSKPITNLKGMGIGSRVLHSAAEYEGNLTADHMWMPLLHGRHVSSDVAVVDGIPCWWRHVTGAGGIAGRELLRMHFLARAA
jgi:hypothetical protein